MPKFSKHLPFVLGGFFASIAFAEQEPTARQQTGPTVAGRAADPKDGQVVASGVVVDAMGKPVAGAETNAVVLSRRPKDHPLAGSTVASVVGRATTDAGGSFSMQIRRTSAPQDMALELFAYAEGQGIDGRYLEMGQDRYEIKIALPKELTIAAKLLGPGGEPLAAASIALWSITIPNGQKQSGPFLSSPPAPQEFSAWPRPYVTEKDGAFVIRGAVTNRRLDLEIDDNRVARQRWTITGEETPAAVVWRCEPPRDVEGQVVAGESRLPIAGATVVLTTAEQHGAEFVGRVTATTDALGRFSLRPYKGSQLAIRVVTADGSYPPLVRRISWVDGTSTQCMILPLYGANYKREDETTPDGRLASTIDSDYPPVKVEHRRPSQPLTAKVTGTIVVDATFTPRDGNGKESIQGVIGIDPETGQWRMIAKNAREPRVSPDGRQLAYVAAESDELQIVSLRSPELPRPIVKKSAGPASWIPGGEEVVVNVQAPRRRDYQGEEYWGEENEKWRISARGEKLRTIPVPPLYDVHDISPVGRWLAMHWDTHASFTGAQLYVARLDGSELKPIARKRKQYYWYPRFSPDGKNVLAKHLNAADDGPWMSAHVIALDGSQERSITVREGFSAEYVCWSPDGQHIAIAAYADSAPTASRTSKLFIVDWQGTQIREVALANADEVSLGTIDWTAGSVVVP